VLVGGLVRRRCGGGGGRLVVSFWRCSEADLGVLAGRKDGGGLLVVGRRLVV